jgi:hypothetical protein
MVFFQIFFEHFEFKFLELQISGSMEPELASGQQEGRPMEAK